MMSYKILTAVLLLAASTMATNHKPFTNTCVNPLLDNNKTMCSQMDEFSQCFIDTQVPSGSANRAAIFSTVTGMSRVMDQFKQENCDLNEEFNNECADDFVDCLDMILIHHISPAQPLSVNCSESALTEFHQCTRKELPDSYAPCYFAPFIEKIVDSFRGVVCTSPPTTTQAPAQPTTTVRSSEGHCDTADGLRFHVYKGCTVFRLEWLQQRILYKPQPVAPGTKFDLSICGLNHASLVDCN